jgi:hypothetical protein
MCVSKIETQALSEGPGSTDFPRTDLITASSEACSGAFPEFSGDHAIPSQ